MIVRFRRLFQRNAQQCCKARWKCRRKNRIAFNDTGIAVRRAPTRPAAIDQRNGQTALGEMNANRGADNAGSKHDGIDARHETLRRPISSQAAIIAVSRRWKIKSSAGLKREAQTVAMVWLALVELTSCACICINCSRKLLLVRLEALAKALALDDEVLLLDGAAVVSDTDDPSA
jgi:hypothetical protein